MPIFKGNKKIENILKGTQQIESVFLGEAEVWNNNTWYLKYLGVGTSFNLNNMGLDVSKLSADNFMATGSNGSIYGYCEKVYSSTTPSQAWFPITKSYSNGVITFHYGTYSRNIIQSKAIPIYLISHQKIEGATKIKDKNFIYLGKGKTFNVASVYSDYANLTADNFYFKGGDMSVVADGPDVSGAGPVEANGYITKSYNSGNGSLTFYNTASWVTTTGALDVWLAV